MYDAIIVGSGLSGVAAAHQMRSRNILMLDIGYPPPSPVLPPHPLWKLKEENDPRVFQTLIGSRFQSLCTLDGPYRSSKLKGPLMDYVMTGTPPRKLADVGSFDPHISFAKGGLANAWGAGVFKLTTKEAERFPFPGNQFEPFYNELTKLIGISGCDDDLTRFLGPADGLLPPLQLSPLTNAFMSKYQRRRDALNHLGIYVGRLRAAIITQAYDGRSPYVPRQHDFFQSVGDSVYHPSITLDRMIASGDVKYINQHRVVTFSQNSSGVEVVAENVITKAIERFQAKKLLLAAGALNTAKIVLQSNNDYSSKLPLLDNGITFIPFIDPMLIGSRCALDFFPGAELILVDDQEELQASIYGLNGPLMTDLLAEMPLTVRDNICATKFMLPAMGMLQLFYPDYGDPANYLRLNSNGSIEYSYSRSVRSLKAEQKMRALLFKFFYLAKGSWCKRPPPGSSIHYAGALPMQSAPGRYQTSEWGRLQGTEDVYIVDGASLPFLPAKNHSFTMMANSMRIASQVIKELG